MKDFLGQEIKIGDTLFYASTGRYAYHVQCVVTRMTEKTMWVDVIKSARQVYGNGLDKNWKITTPNHCVVINKLLETTV